MSILDPIAATIKNPFSTTVNNGGLRGNDFSQGFEMVEFIDGVAQDSNSGGTKDTAITLIGNMMPMQPFEWGGEQRLSRDYYPGNPEPSVHILGSKEDDLAIHGRFKDKHYRDSSYYGAAFEYAKACDQMKRRGNLVRFGMRGEKGAFIRYGYLLKVHFKMNKLSWIDYEMTFLVVGDTPPKGTFFASPEKTAPDSVNQNLINAAFDFNSTYSQSPSSMPQSLAGLINGLTSDIASNIKVLTGFVAAVISAGQDVVASAHRALGLIKAVRVQLNQFRRQIDSIAHSFDSHTSSGNNVSKASDTYKNLAHIAGARSSSNTLSAYCAQLQAQYETLSKTFPLARYKVIPGDSLQRLSIKYYNTADNWQKIYTHNKLASTVLTPGMVLEIPKL